MSSGAINAIVVGELRPDTTGVRLRVESLNIGAAEAGTTPAIQQLKNRKIHFIACLLDSNLPAIISPATSCATGFRTLSVTGGMLSISHGASSTEKIRLGRREDAFRSCLECFPVALRCGGLLS